MSITKQVVLLPVLLAVAIFVALSLLVSDEMGALTDSIARENLRQTQNVFEANIRSLSRLSEMAGVLKQDALLAKAVKERDVAKVKEMAVRLVKDYPLDFSTIAGADGVILARGHEDKAGDSMADKQNFKAAMAGKPITAIESGSQVKLSVRSGVPLYLDGTIVGVAAVGMNIATSEFVDSIKKEMNVEATIFLDDTRAATTIVKPDGQRAIGTKLDNPVIYDAVVGKGETYYGNSTILGKEYAAVYWPIVDLQGKRIGIYFAGKEVTEIAQAAATIRKQFFLVGSIVLVVAIVLGLLFAAKVGRSIRARDHWYRQIFDTVRAPVIVTDTEGKPSLLNRSALEAQYRGLLTEEGGALAVGAKQPLQTLQSRGDGTLPVELDGRFFEADVSYLNDEKGRRIGMFELFNDVHDKKNMEQLVVNIAEIVAQVRQGSMQINNASQMLSRNSISQADSLSAVNQAMEELSRQSLKSADDLAAATKLAEDARAAGDTGNTRMTRMIDSMRRITSSAEEIKKINKIIDDIAFQTNLLALNAAVEAARAGRYGKGFAVVAEEVRNLASRSAKAARETSDKIESTVSQISEGSTIAQDTAAALVEITAHAAKVTGITSEVAQAGKLQSQKVEQIAQSLKSIDQSTQSNAAGAEETAAAATELNKMADDLSALTSGQSAGDAGEAPGGRQTLRLGMEE